MLSKRTFVVIALLLLSYFKPYAQVSLQTGSAVFSLPMFNWQDDKSRLNSAVGLSYSSGNGLKVNDMASNEGQGWNLAAGGMITRMQVGEPDDQPAYAGAYPQNGDQDITKYPAGYLYGTTPIENGCPSALTKYPTYGGQNVLYAQHNLTAQDKQHDYFAFQFNGKTGIFVIDTSGGWHGVALGDTKMLISLQVDPTMTSQGIRTTITSFTITDVDGLIYKFTYHGLTRLLSALFSNADGSKKQGQPKIGNGGIYCQSAFDLGPTGPPWYNQTMANPYIISNWYLSEIDDPFTTRKITIGYKTLNLSNSAGQDISYNNSSDQYVVISYKKSITTTLEIDSITYPDGHLVNFNYSPVSRYDYPGESALASVTIRYNGRYLSEFQLNTNYFILNRYGNPTTAYEKSVARLCLQSVKKIGVDLKEDSPPYLFDYYTSSGSGTPDDLVPPPFFVVKDIWGYYNGNNSIASNSPLTGTTIPVSLITPVPYNLGYYALKGLCFQNDNVSGTYYNAKPQYAENGLLKQIVYPTGGSLVYQYAQNSGSFMNSSTVLNVGGVHVSQTSSYDGGYSNGCGTPIVTQYNYVMNGAGSASSLWGLETPVNTVTSNNFWKEERETWHFSWSDPFGECLWHYVYPGIQSQYEAVSIEGWQRIMIEIAPVLGILSVAGTIDDVINLMASSGFLTVAAVVLDVISAVLGYILSCPQKTKNTLNTVYYDFDLNQASPLPVQFKRVEITESPGTIGKTVQQFTQGDPNDPNGPDYPLWFAAGTNTSFSAKQRFAPWAYGLPKLTDVYDVNGNKIKETQNVYDFTNAQEVLTDPAICFPTSWWSVASYKCLVLNNYSQRSDSWSNPTLYNTTYLTASTGDMNVDLYYTYTGHTQLATTYERNYRTTDATQYVQTETDYFYNSGNICMADNGGQKVATNYDANHIETKQSNGDVNYKYIYYPTDYNYTTGIMATLVQKNIYSVPITTQTYVVKAGSNSPQYLSEKVTEFVQLANGDVKPSRTLEQRFATPAGTLTPYSGPTTTNYANYKIPEVFTYDVNGNLTGLQDEGNRNVTNIYDYNDKYIVATVSNANPVADKPAYTSFESGDLSRSGWSLSGSGPVYSTTSYITGSQGLVLNGNTLGAPLNTAEPYILSFWANNASVVVSMGASLVKSAPTYNGMTYYEYNIASGTGGVTLSGNSIIDELRLYPQTARMRTTTYDPLLGKTSECDENNRITYYTYDNLGRMQFVEDESHNIVKMYEYNSVSQAKQTGCPSTFSNNLISEIFTRSNCGAGYQGGNATYTVAANTYTSAISQQDADIQAEISLLTNGQNYANANGTCSLIYYNIVQSQIDTTQTCSEGYSGGLVTYTVPAGTYSSIISQADANQQALNDIAANAQAYTNSPFNEVCVVDTAQDWEWQVGDSTDTQGPSYCLSVNGQLPPHLFIELTDVNPNSPTYNHTEWVDDGPNSACPAGNYYNPSESGVFYRNNCATGSGSAVTYTIPPGEYSSTISQAAATQLATNDIAANGQNYANSNGTCCTPIFVLSGGITPVVITTSLSGTTVSFTWVFDYPSGGLTIFQLGNITSSCGRPTSVRTIPFILGSTTYDLIISPLGVVSLQIIAGPVPTTGEVGFSGTYDLNLNAFYSAAESGSFTRNNCLSGQTGSTVTYTVPQYAYNSLTSQAAANQLAINAVNANGQINANSAGTCSSVCSFTWNSGISTQNGGTISSNGTTGSFNLNFMPATNGYTGGSLGTIVGSCKPSVTRTLTVTDGATPSRTWNVTVNSSGVISISLASGAAGTTSPPPIVIAGTYNL